MNLDSPVGAPEQDRADGLEQEVGEPDNDIGHEFRPMLQGLTDENEAVVTGDQEQRHGDADIRFTPMDADAEGDSQ